jgi:hypothetical protein
MWAVPAVLSSWRPSGRLPLRTTATTTDEPQGIPYRRLRGARTPGWAGPPDRYVGLSQSAVDRAGRHLELGGQPSQRPASLVEADRFGEIPRLDATTPKHTLPLKDVVHRVPVNTEPRSKRVHPGTRQVRGDRSVNLVGTETLLRLLRRTLGHLRSRRLGQIEEEPEAFYVVTMVRISPDKVHFHGIT